MSEQTDYNNEGRWDMFIYMLMFKAEVGFCSLLVLVVSLGQ